nr:carboxyltransferase domain-containing protein [Variovorax sp. E3]
MSGQQTLSEKEGPWRMAPAGDSCLVVELGPVGPGASSRWSAAAAAALREAGIPGVTDIVSAMTTVGIHYRPESIRCLSTQDETPYQAAARQVRAVLDGFECRGSVATRIVEIPVCYGGEHGPDLTSVAQACGLTPRELIDLHTSADARFR